MGLAKGAMQLLLDECVRVPFQGTVATLGRQHIYFRFDQLRKSANDRGLTLKEVEVCLHREPQLASQEFLSDETFLKAIGFSEVASLDFSDYEQPDILVDLNQKVPPELFGRFDVIIDGGTLEHIFHLPQALNNLFLMLRPGGRVIHLNPASNYVDHSFYMFSPTLYWDFYSTNEFEINGAKLIRITGDHAKDPWEVVNYVPGSLDATATGGLDNKKYQLFFIATKTSRSTGDRIPQQGFYRKTWNPPHDAAVVVPRGDKVRQAVKEIPIVRELTELALTLYRSHRQSIDSLIRFFKRPRRGSGLKVVARY